MLTECMTPRSVSSRNSKSIGVGRSQTTSPGVGDELAVIHEVRTGFTTQRLEDQCSQFKDDPLFHSVNVTELVRCGRVA